MSILYLKIFIQIIIISLKIVDLITVEDPLPF